MAAPTIVDSEGQLVDGPPSTLSAEIIEGVTADGVEFVLNAVDGWAMAYLKARTELVDRANRVAYYHAIATGPDPMPQLIRQLQAMEDTTQWQFLTDEVHADVIWEWDRLTSSDLSWDSLAQEAMREAVDAGDQLTFSMADHADAIRAIKHFADAVDTSFAISSYGRTPSLAEIGVVMIPDQSANFTASDAQTAKAIGERRARFRDQRPTRLRNQYQRAIRRFIAGYDGDAPALYADLESLRTVLYRETAITRDAFAEIAAVRAAVTDDPYLTDRERQQLLREGVNFVVSEQQSIATDVEQEYRERLVAQVKALVAEAPRDPSARHHLLTDVRHALSERVRYDGPLGEIQEAIARSPAVSPASERRIAAAGLQIINSERQAVQRKLRTQLVNDHVEALRGLPHRFADEFRAPGALTPRDVELAIVDAFPQLQRAEPPEIPRPQPQARQIAKIAGVILVMALSVLGLLAVIDQLFQISWLF